MSINILINGNKLFVLYLYYKQYNTNIFYNIQPAVAI